MKYTTITPKLSLKMAKVFYWFFTKVLRREMVPGPGCTQEMFEAVSGKPLRCNELLGTHYFEKHLDTDKVHRGDTCICGEAVADYIQCKGCRKVEMGYYLKSEKNTK